ncbi:MAG: hypothetical protein IJ325_12350 [Clostridia bacterium]|nr:hypothetical protein [Clostridia bacterium]
MYGGAIYSLLEILWRGHTHWTMALTGGVCLLLIHLMDEHLGKMPFFLRCLTGAMLITAIEFGVGVVVNLFLGLEVWDYSERWGNILGQICPAFTVLWFGLCIPALLLTRKIAAILEDPQITEKHTAGSET